MKHFEEQMTKYPSSKITPGRWKKIQEIGWACNANNDIKRKGK